MTAAQKHSLVKLHDDYLANAKEYSSFGGRSYCTFSVYENQTKVDDVHITVEWCKIEGLDDFNFPYTATKIIIIDEYGNLYDAQGLKEVFKTEADIAAYMRKLTKIKWDEK